MWTMIGTVLVLLFVVLFWPRQSRKRSYLPEDFMSNKWRKEHIYRSGKLMD